MPKRLIFYDLPRRARDLIYNYLELTGKTIDLNYTELTVYPRDDYPDNLWAEHVSCFHDQYLEMTRREDYWTLAEYWEHEEDSTLCRYTPLGAVTGCDNNDCGHCTEFTYPCLAWMKYDPKYREIFEVVHQRNHFRICSGSPGGFAPFHKLIDYAVYMLRTLTIRLDGKPPETISLGEDWSRLEELAPLDLRSRYGKHAMRDWEKLIKQLARCTWPNRLTLYIIAKASDSKTAEAVLKPLNQLATLKGCGIWLSPKHDPEIDGLIRDTVRRLTTSVADIPSTPFRYLDLPRELRFRILEYTDLVSKGDLEWKPRVSSLGPLMDPKCSCQHELGYQYYEIGHIPGCTRTLVSPETCVPESHDVHFRSRHCFCERERWITTCKRSRAGFCVCIFHCKEHSAYSNTLYSSRQGAHPLFLVSHEVRQDAIPVFFQRNRFFITPPGSMLARNFHGNPSRICLHDLVIPMRRSELSLFLSSIPTIALRHIRYLEWVFPQFENYRSAPKSSFLDYLDTIELIANGMNLSRLTLVVNMRVIRMDTDGQDIFEWPIRRARDGEVYDRILKPLARLEGLKDCWIYLRRIMKGNPDYYSRAQKDRCLFDKDEMRYEKLIMGPEYDSAKRLKPWKERYEGYIDCEGHEIEAYGHYAGWPRY